MYVTWTPQARRLRDKLVADSPEYGFRIARRALHLAEYRAAQEGLNEAVVGTGDIHAARGLAGDEFLPKGE